MLMEHTKLDEYFFAMIYSPLFGGHGMRTIVLRGKHQQPRSSLSCWQPGNWPGWRRRRRRRRTGRRRGKGSGKRCKQFAENAAVIHATTTSAGVVKSNDGRKKEGN